MVGASRFRSDQKTNEIDRRAVEGMKIDRADKPRENPEDRVRLGELAVRNSDSFADSCRAKPLALEQGVENFPRREAGDQSSPLAQLLQRVFLRVHLERGHYCLGGDQFGQQHGLKQSGAGPLIGIKPWMADERDGAADHTRSPLALSFPARVDPADVSVGAAVYD